MGEVDNPMKRKQSLKRRSTKELPVGPDRFDLNAASEQPRDPGLSVGQGLTMNASVANTNDIGSMHSKGVLGEITEDGQYSAERKGSIDQMQSEDARLDP